MRQVETSRTIVFDAPERARGFFEALCTDNLDVGRPDDMEIDLRPASAATPGVGEFRTAVVTGDNDGEVINAFYKHSRIKQYLKDGRALRIETVVNDPNDLGIKRRLEHLDDLQAKSRAANRRLLQTERVGQGCVFASPAFERVASPTVPRTAGRAPALRFGDPRVMALAGALAASVHAVTGQVTNKSLRALVTTQLGAPLHQQPDELRPAPPAPQRPDRTASGPPTLPPHPRRTAFRRVLHQAPQPPATPAQPPISRQPRHRYERPCAPSTFTSQKPSTKRGSYRTPPNNSRQLSKS